jgi:hypothetical protein
MHPLGLLVLALLVEHHRQVIHVRQRVKVLLDMYPLTQVKCSPVHLLGLVVFALAVEQHTRHTKPRLATCAMFSSTAGNIRRIWHMHRISWLKRTLICVRSWCAATFL